MFSILLDTVTRFHWLFEQPAKKASSGFAGRPAQNALANGTAPDGINVAEYSRRKIQEGSDFTDAHKIHPFTVI